MPLVCLSFEKSFGRIYCLQRYTKCVAFLELNGIKKSCPVSVRFLLGIFCYLMGHFPNPHKVQNPAGAPWKRGTGASFRRSCDGSTRNVQAVKNIDFSYFINLIRNSSMLRPLELDVQPMFCRFSSANEHQHMSDRSTLVLYPASAVVSSVVSSRFICKLILKVHKISIFEEYTRLSPVEIPDLKPPMPSEFQS